MEAWDTQEYGGENLSGSLLAAHPSLKDPNFHKSVILISAHGDEEGALGLVINQPMGKNLGDMDGDFAYGPLASVGVFKGGPVNPDQLLLAAWKWDKAASAFRLFFGITPDKASTLLQQDPAIEVRAFVGYSGWSKGQLEGEMEANAWVAAPVEATLMEPDPATWRRLIQRTRPELLFLADEPDDPSLN